MDWISKLFGTRRGSAPAEPAAVPPLAHPPQRAPSPSTPEPQAFDAVAATFDCRDRYWRTVGTVEPDVLSYLISPALMGGPAWPTTRQAFRVVRTSRSILLATDGLSDPFDDVDGMGNGFEMELFLETGDIDPQYDGATGDLNALRSSWALAVLQHVADTVAHAGGIAPDLDRHGVISIELPGLAQSPSVEGQVPPRFFTEDGDLGALLGVSAAGRAGLITDAPLSPIRLTSIVLLTAAELAHVRTGESRARNELAAALAARPDGHFSDLQRPSLV